MRNGILLLLVVVIAVPCQGQLIAGTALNPVGFGNDAHEIDPLTGGAVPVFSQAVWGATYDVAMDRVLFTSDVGPGDVKPGATRLDENLAEGVQVGGDALWEYSPATGMTSFIGFISQVTGAPFRIDGLAISNGILYGSRAAANQDGIYEIDQTTLVATLVLPLTDSISGIDADPATGIIYGVNDTTGNLVEIDPVGGTVTSVAAYPDPGEGDLDGIAVGDGRAYLFPDDPTPGLIYVYDFAAGAFDAPIPAPWIASDTFSGGALIPTQPVPSVGATGLAVLAVALGAAATLALRRRRFDCA